MVEGLIADLEIWSLNSLGERRSPFRRIVHQDESINRDTMSRFVGIPVCGARLLPDEF